MCGFAVSNRFGLLESNKFCQRRGPDFTSTKMINGVQFLHNLLHITGSVTPQPFMKNDIVAVFNGEIYNYKQFGNYKSDGYSIIDRYLDKGDSFISDLDGEFALCLIDFAKKKIIVGTDVFSCKPLWMSIEGNYFGFSSYKSQLTLSGFADAKKVPANTTLVFDLMSLQQINEIKNVTFDINQHKDHPHDWISAFERSIHKRTQNTGHGMFIGLSSGYDSGAIACELTKQNVDFKAYSIIANENLDVLDRRTAKLQSFEYLTVSPEKFKETHSELISDCEDFKYNDKFKNYDIKADRASIGLATICKEANKEGRRVYFSGQGADEIISDYGFNGRKIYNHSSFGGKFPERLDGFFPWHSFWDGTQIQYLNKEEYVAGHYGIETRYPFLDKDLVQEFLWLSAKIKNSKYKSVLHDYLEINAFPFFAGQKYGFSPI